MIDSKTLKQWKLTAFLNLYGLARIPLLAFISPRVIEFTKEKCIVSIPLNYRSKNHLGAMYFGALAMGSELSIATPAVIAIGESKRKVDFIFKNFKCEFSKRSDGDVHFVCEESTGVRELIEKSMTSSERLEKTFKGYAIVPSQGTEPVMNYELTLSVKCRDQRAVPL
ncbi:MAG: DUF4442 domain-containing protein [Pseudobdellovibrionaceae bacterium]